MSTFVSLDGLIGWVLLALPLLIFVAVAVWALRPGRKGDGENLDSVHRLSGVGSEVGSERRDSDVIDGRALKSGAEFQHVFQLRQKIERAKEEQESSELVLLYYELAGHLRSQGDHDKASASLREGLGISIRLDLKEEQARSRLEMAEIMAERGDLVSACEQWQMARELFAATNCQTESAAVDAKMRKIGCPTDWVLNEF